MALGPQLTPLPGETVIAAGGGLLLPGLHDHHLHFHAWLAARQSLDCSPDKVRSAEALAELLASAPSTGWLRGVGYREDVVGDLRHADLERLCPGRPVRLQHSSGKMWLLNSTACDMLALEQHHLDGIERDTRGQVTGRLFRLDHWLGEQLRQASEPQTGTQTGRIAKDGTVPSDWQAAQQQLLAFGLTGFTDASYTNTAASTALFADLLPHCWLMGDETLATGPLKIMLDEDRLPSLDSLVERIRAAHARHRCVAFHCVTRVELVFLLAALQQAGVADGDRIEHGAVIPPECIPQIRDAGLCVVTQPGFIAARGERFRRDVAEAEHADLYRFASLLAAGITVVASSDAPYGPLNPWSIMHSAVTRQTEAGVALGLAEAVSPKQALAGYLTAPDHPGGPPRQLAVGQSADLCLLRQNWMELSAAGLDTAVVEYTVVDGEVAYANDANTASVCSPS